VTARAPGAGESDAGGMAVEQAEKERVWALVSARAEGVSIRTLGGAAGLSPTRVQVGHQRRPGPVGGRARPAARGGVAVPGGPRRR
jgi:hypothetical protein